MWNGPEQPDQFPQPSASSEKSCLRLSHWPQKSLTALSSAFVKSAHRMLPDSSRPEKDVKYTDETCINKDALRGVWYIAE